MDITAFYEVQDRLYNAAIAGCGILSEDFRLKRAIEGLAPLAQKGKVFAALKTRCEGLFTAGEDEASQLSDCIALVDAVAVTLGQTGATAGGADTNSVANLQTWPSMGEGASPIQDIPHSLLSEVMASLERGGETVSFIPRKYPKVLLDARFVAKLIEKLNGKNSNDIDVLAEKVMDIYGEILVAAVKASIDFADEKAKGRQVKLIEHVCGAKENDWYLELAQSEDVPQQVRLAAIAALVHVPENEAVLMEIYKTQKGKVKNAALEALARMGAQGIQANLEKICGKEKLSQAEEHLILVSPSPVCEAYAVGRAKQYQQDPDRKVDTQENFMAYKTGESAAEGYLALLDGTRKKKWGKFSSSVRADIAQNTEWNICYHLQRMAVDNLFWERPGAAELIERLYQEEPGVFAGARAYARLMDGTLALDDFKRVGDGLGLTRIRSQQDGFQMYEFAVEMAGRLHDTPIIERYKLEWVSGEGHGKWLERHYPKVLLEVLTGKEALKNEVSAILCCNTLVDLCWNSMSEEEKGPYQNFVGRGYGAGRWDAELFREYAFPFFKDALKKMPALYYGCNIYRVMPNDQGREDWYWEWVKRSQLKERVRVAVQWNYSWKMDLPGDRMRREVDYAIAQLEKQKLLLNKELFGRTMDMLKWARDE